MLSNPYSDLPCDMKLYIQFRKPGIMPVLTKSLFYMMHTNKKRKYSLFLR